MLKTEVDKINRVGAHAETEGMDKEMVKVLKLPAEIEEAVDHIHINCVVMTIKMSIIFLMLEMRFSSTMY